MGEGERKGVVRGERGEKGGMTVEQIDALGFKRLLKTFLFSRY